MGYRDDQEGLRIRVAELEEQLAAADRNVARLQGALPSGQRTPPLTTPLRLRREIEGELSDEGLEALARTLDVRMPDRAPVDRSGRTLRQQAPAWVLLVEPNGRGGTRLALTERAAGRRRAILLAALSMVITTVVAANTIVLSKGGPVATAFAALALAIVLLGAPLAYVLARRQRQRLVGAFEAAVMKAAEHAISERSDAGRGNALRIASDDGDAEEEARAEAEAEADEALQMKRG